MIIRSLSVSNFLGYRKRCSIDFKGRKTIGIVGNNECGKSSLLMAITYALHGRIPNQGETREVAMIATGSTADLVVELEAELPGGEILSITRGRTRSNQAILKVAGQQGKATELDQEIGRRLGLSFNDFVSLSYFVQGDIHQFMEGDKRAYFARWATALTRWERYATALKEQATLVDTRLSRLTADAAVLAEKTTKEVWEAVRLELMEARAESSEATKRVDLADEQVTALVEENASLAREASTAVASADGMRREARRIDSVISSLEGKLRGLDELESELGRGVCPVLKTACRDLIEHSAEKRIATGEAAEVVREQLAAARLDRKKLSATAVTLESSAVAHQKASEKTDALRKAKGDVQEWRGRLARAQARLARAELAIKTYKQAREDLEVKRQAIITEEEDERRVQFLRFMCGKSGIPLSVIELELAAVEQRCNWVLDRLDYPKRIKFAAYRELAGFEKVCPVCGGERWAKDACPSCKIPRPRKRKDEPTVTVLDGVSERAFNLESGGAKVLQSFAVRLACSLFVADMMGTKVRMVMLDEIFAMLDPSNRQKLMALVIDKLSAEFGLEQQFVVSHHEDVVNAVDDILVVRKRGGSSTAQWA